MVQKLYKNYDQYFTKSWAKSLYVTYKVTQPCPGPGRVSIIGFVWLRSLLTQTAKGAETSALSNQEQRGTTTAYDGIGSPHFLHKTLAGVSSSS